MSDFSDAEDRALIQLVLKNQSANGSIDWDAVTESFPRRARKPKLVLRHRLNTLKRTHGRDIRAFPAYFFRGTSRTEPHSVSRAQATVPPAVMSFQELLSAPLPLIMTSPQALISSSAPQTTSTGQAASANAVSTVRALPAVTGLDSITTQVAPARKLIRRPKPVLELFSTAVLAGDSVSPGTAEVTPLNECDMYMALTRIFDSITRAQVYQPTGQGELNSGEILPDGVTKMVEVMNMGPSDIFGDIGSGTGSVVAQVALQTQAVRCIGLEIRDDLADLSLRTISQFVGEYPRLKHVSILSGDIKYVSKQERHSLRSCSIVFCNNMVFNPVDNLAVEDFVTASNARKVLLTNRFCGRCRGDKCTRAFCRLYKSEPPIMVPSSWTANPCNVFVYSRRNAPITLMELLEEISDDE